MGSVVKGIGSTIGKIGGMAAPIIGMLPGGSAINAGIAGIGALSNSMGSGNADPSQMSNGLSGMQMAGLGAAGLGTMGLMGGFKPNIGSTSNGATQTGNDFSNYLGGFMQNGNQNQAMMNHALTSMLSGRPGDPTNLQNYFNAGMGSNGQPSTGMSGGIQPINVGFTPPQFNPQQVGSQYNQPQFQNPNLPDVTQGIGTQAQLGNIINPQANVSAMSALMDKQRLNDVANLRERFGNQALSSGAQLGESNYLAQALPQQALALDQMTRANNEQALTQRSQDLQNYQGSRGLDVSQLGLGSQNSLSMGSMLNNFNMNNSQFGATQNLQSQLANQGMGYNAAQLGSQNNQFGANLNQQGQSLNNQFALQNQGLGNNFNLGMQGIGTQLQGMQAGAQQNALSQIMASLGHTQGLGTAQAETTVAPSWGSQVINGAGALGGLMGQINQAQNARPNVTPSMLPNGITPEMMSQWFNHGSSDVPSIQQTPNNAGMIPGPGAMLPNIGMMNLPQNPNIMQQPMWNTGIGGF